MKPYTYLIKHKPSQRVYYGVRYANNCHPDDLWATYFTSCKEIKRLLERDGIHSFEFEIRRTFDTKEAAVAWERKVLLRMKVLDNPEKWFNRNIAGSLIWTNDLRERVSKKLKGHVKSAETREKLRQANMGKVLTEEHRQKLSEAKRGKAIPHLWSEEVKEKRRQRMVGRKVSDHVRQSLFNAVVKKPMTDGKKIFESMEACARYYKTHVNTIKYRLKSMSEKFKEWKYV